MSIMSQALTLILAGDRPDRLFPLMAGRPKALLPFGGIFSILDFTISNCVNSDVERAYVLTQYKSNLIQRHIDSSLWRTELVCVPPRSPRGYRGTADALYQNLDLLRDRDRQYILVLPADHLYKMNYNRLLRFHAGHGGDATIAASSYPGGLANETGLLRVSRENRILALNDRAKHSAAQNDGSRMFVSMGVCVFNASALHKALLREAGHFGNNHDLENDVLKSLIHSDRVFAYDSGAEDSRLGSYWSSVDTIDAYHRAHMEMLALNSPSDAYQDARWPIYAGGRPAVCCVVADPPHRVLDSIIAESADISGAGILQSVIFPCVSLSAGASVEKSILLRGVRVGPGARIRRTIICEGVEIPAGEQIGFDLYKDRGRFVVTDNGVVVVHSTPVGKAQKPPLPRSIAKIA